MLGKERTNEWAWLCITAYMLIAIALHLPDGSSELQVQSLLWWTGENKYNTEKSNHRLCFRGSGVIKQVYMIMMGPMQCLWRLPASASTVSGVGSADIGRSADISTHSTGHSNHLHLVLCHNSQLVGKDKSSHFPNHILHISMPLKGCTQKGCLICISMSLSMGHPINYVRNPSWR